MNANPFPSRIREPGTRRDRSGGTTVQMDRNGREYFPQSRYPASSSCRPAMRAHDRHGVADPRFPSAACQDCSVDCAQKYVWSNTDLPARLLGLSRGGSVSQESREVVLQVLTIEITKISKAERLQACPGRPDWSQHFCPLPHRGTPKLKEQLHMYGFV